MGRDPVELAKHAIYRSSALRCAVLVIPKKHISVIMRLSSSLRQAAYSPGQCPHGERLPAFAASSHFDKINARSSKLCLCLCFGGQYAFLILFWGKSICPFEYSNKIVDVIISTCRGNVSHG